MTSITGILLAAGDGRRFGGRKLLHPLPGGESVGVVAARNLIEAVPDAVAVVRPGDRELSAVLSAVGMRIVENPAAADGMYSGYDATQIHAYSRELGHVPLIDTNPRRDKALKEDPANESKRQKAPISKRPKTKVTKRAVPSSVSTGD